MPRSFSFPLVIAFFAAASAAGQSAGSKPEQSNPTAQDSAAPTDAKKPKKVWTNEDLPNASSPVSVVGDPKSKTKPGKTRPANDAYAASVRQKLEKLQKQIDDADKQIADLKSFSQGDSSNNASGIQLHKSYNREPIEVQIRALEDKKKNLQAQIDSLLDEARKKGVEPGQLR